MTQQWLAAASKAVRRGIRANAATARVSAAHTSSKRLSAARAFTTGPHPSETFLTGTNNAYVEEMYDSWKTNPQRYVRLFIRHSCI